jgi:aryl-alcohol dehydrogenase-like predicted oxidoreductase
MKRRFFLKSMLATGVTVSIGCQKGGKMQAEIPRRRYRDDVDLSIAGFGGIIVVGKTQSEANQIVAQAIDCGVNYFDVAPSYGNGEAEEKLGIALKPFRKQAFLACKTLARDAAGAEKEFIQSQKRLFTDYFDLYQFHAVNTPEEVAQLLGKDGAAEFVLKMREQGQIRYLGFSAHTETAAVALMEQFPFDSVLFPINFICFAQGNFGPQVVQQAKEKGVALLALKALALRKYREGDEKKYPNCWYVPNDDPELAQQAFNFTLSEGAVSAVSPGEQRLFELEQELARNFQPLRAAERRALFEKSVGLEPIFRT